jgi:hypothetical protein
MAKQVSIKWKVIEVELSKIKPTPNNFKLKTEDGSARFKTSVDNYGLAGSVILNLDLTLIDGNTRVEEAKRMGMKKIFASIPSRKLTAREFTEFAAMYDMARAGEVDIKRIKDELGTTESFFKKWGIEMPKVSLNKLAELEMQDKVVNPTAKRDTGIKEIATRQLTLVYTNQEAEEVITMAEAIYSKLKVTNLSDLVYKLIKDAKKAYKK